MTGRSRTFDYDEVRRLRAAGVNLDDLATQFGVSRYAIAYALEPARRQATTVAWHETHRTRCTTCGKLRGLTVQYRPGDTGLCIRCLAAARTVTVRPDTLLCGSCDEWKPDEAFTPQRAATARRSRHGECKPCAAARRREERARKRVAA